MMEEPMPIIDHKQPPTTVREVGIHLIYMSKNMTEINKKLDEMSGTFAHRQELLDAITQRKADQAGIIEDLKCVSGRVTALETYLAGINKKIAGVAVTALILMVLALYGLEKYFRL